MFKLKYFFYWLLCGLLYLIPSIAIADAVNAESRRAGSEREGAFGDFQFQGRIQYGNTSLINLETSGLLGFRRRRHTLFGFGNFSFTSESFKDRENIQNSAMGHIRYNFELKKWIYWELFTQAQSDQNTFVSLRYLVGTGPRFVPFRNDEHLLVIGTAYMPEYEILDRNVIQPYPSNFSSRKTWVHRWSSYISYRTDITEQFIFQTTLYVQPRFDRFNDVKVYNDNVLTMEINDLLDFGVSFGVGFDNEPPSACIDDDACGKISPLDLVTQLGLKVKI